MWRFDFQLAMADGESTPTLPPTMPFERQNHQRQPLAATLSALTPFAAGLISPAMNRSFTIMAAAKRRRRTLTARMRARA